MVYTKLLQTDVSKWTVITSQSYQISKIIPIWFETIFIFPYSFNSLEKYTYLVPIILVKDFLSYMPYYVFLTYSKKYWQSSCKTHIGGALCLRAFAYLLFYFSIKRSMNVLFVAITEAAMHAQKVAWEISHTCFTIQTESCHFLLFQVQYSFSVFPISVIIQILTLRQSR